MELYILKHLYLQTFAQLGTQIERSVDTKRCESLNMYMSRLEYLPVLRIYPGRVPVYNQQIELSLLKYLYLQHLLNPKHKYVAPLTPKVHIHACINTATHTYTNSSIKDELSILCGHTAQQNKDKCMLSRKP